jgi:colicin import membrane protein
LLREAPRPFVYAVLVHALLLALLVFSLDWAPTVKSGQARKKAPVQAVVVDAGKLESEIQRQKQLEEQKQRAEQDELKKLKQQADQAEQKRKKEEQRLAELERKQQQETRRKAEAERKRKAELAARKKAEAEKKRKAEAERKQKEEARKKAEAEQKRKAELEAKRKAEAEAKRKQEEARRKAAERELQARLAAEQERIAAQRQSAMQSMIAEYVQYIREKVERSWIRPPNWGAEVSCTVEVRLIPSGEVIDATIVRSTGNPAFDRSVEAAVFKASPLPVPPDPEVMEEFRSFKFLFKPG